MADITLAEYEGNAWLVSGETYLDDLLSNTLPHGISIELVPCGTRDEVRHLWQQNCDPNDSSADPWLIHPAIVARARRSAPDHAVFFAQWSAMLDEDALAVIRSATIWANDNPDTEISIAEYLDPQGPSMIADLSRLRRQLIEEKLVGEGLKRARIRHITRNVSEVPGMSQESQRIDISVRPESPPEAPV